MKYVLLLVLSLGMIGCATYPKEDLKEVFQLVQEKKFDEANSKLKGRYETYSGEYLEAVKDPSNNKDSAEGLIESAKGAILYCDKASKDAIDMKANEYQDRSEMNTAHEDFVQYCVEPLDEFNSYLFKIKKYAEIDLKPMLKGYGQVFFKASRMVSAEFDRIDRDHDVEAAREQATKEAYEKTEEYWQKKLCESNDRIKLAQKIIKRESDAKDISGYEDRKKLYEAGKVIQSNTERINFFSGEFKVRFGKDFDSGVCGG